MRVIRSPSLIVTDGRVVSRVTIDEAGNVSGVAIVSSEPPQTFDQAVIEAIKTWKFQTGGKKCVGEVETNFKLTTK